MRTKPNNEPEDGDFEDYEDTSEFEFSLLTELTEELTEELARYLGDRWRAEEDNKAIRVNLSLTTALNRIPAKWLDAACQANQLTLQGASRPNRRAKVAALVAALTSEEALRRCVIALPPRARIALRQVIDNGGWMRLADLTRDFGAMDGDGWFWDEAPPTSCLGQLRHRALLFVGRTSLTREGRPGKRTFKVAVVPKDIRDLLKGILSESAIRREDEMAAAQQFTAPEDLLGNALCAAKTHYDVLDWQPPLRLSDAEEFLRYAVQHGLDPFAVWFGIEIFLAFVEVHLHEIQSLDELCGYHISELASSFVDMNYAQRWTLRERRSLIYLVRYLYDHLHARGRILDETHEEVSRACARLVSGKRRLNVIHRPVPLGGELVFTRLNLNTGQVEHYTFNHQRLLMVWAEAFHKDWRTMLSACETVPSGAEKAALIHELIALEPGTCDLIISQADQDDFDRAILWFYDERLLKVSAW